MRSGDEQLNQEFVSLVNDFSKSLIKLLPFVKSLDGVIYVLIASE
jgi:hypothetical protein